MKRKRELWAWRSRRGQYVYLSTLEPFLSLDEYSVPFDAEFGRIDSGLWRVLFPGVSIPRKGRRPVRVGGKAPDDFGGEASW